MAEQRKGVAAGISREQYVRGLELFEAQETTQAIAKAIGLNEHEVAWLATVGDASAGMPHWLGVCAEKAAERRRYQSTVGESIALGAASMIDKAQQICGGAQQMVLVMLASHMTHVAAPAQLELSRGQLDDEADEDWATRRERLVSKMALSRDMRDTLKALKVLADIKTPAETYAAVWANAKLSQQSALSAALRGLTGKVEMGAEAVLPAMVTVVERVPGADQAVADPLDNDPDFAGMTLEELEAYDRTRELPDDAYGSDVPTAKLPDDAMAAIDWDPTSTEDVG